MQKITPFLWFDNQAEEAVNFYTSIFKNSRTGSLTRYDDAGAAASGRPKGSVMTASFRLDGQEFTALNGGPVFKFNPSVSFMVISQDEKEIDGLWKKLSEGGKVLMELNKYDWSKKYGWVQDKYGLSWQLMLSEEKVSHKIIPSFLFVDKVYGKAEEAMDFYTSVFKNAKVESIYKYGPGKEPDKEEAVMYEDFTIEGNKFAAMESAHQHNFNFNEAVSFVVNCENQEELDYYWKKLSAVPQSEMCGWLKDKYGVSWQIVPTVLSKYLSDKDSKKSQRVMQAMLKMKKIDIAGLEKAYKG
ncbi:MAG TPA: VOC family protein [Ignavibacteriaceae bacterium]|nr:VOC family protein [Ignavibacteriaceae bacterium]